MAIISYLDGVDTTRNSRKGTTYDTSQAGPIVKRRPSPTNPSRNTRNLYKTYLQTANSYFWKLTWSQKLWWAVEAGINGIEGPFHMAGDHAANAAFIFLQVNVLAAGDSLYANAPGGMSIYTPSWGTVSRIDDNTIQVAFTPLASWGDYRIYLRQALPGPGYRRWARIDSFMCSYSERSPSSPHDFTTHFPHLTGWNCRYWLGCQHYTGYRSAETLIDLSA